ncbi:MAG: hypothetical protein ACRD3V_23530, partial [Vicinamibacteria bacterium]
MPRYRISADSWPHSIEDDHHAAQFGDAFDFETTSRSKLELLEVTFSPTRHQVTVDLVLESESEEGAEGEARSLVARALERVGARPDVHGFGIEEVGDDEDTA